MVNCENCKNKNICKFAENTKAIIEQTKSLDILAMSPISIDINCSMFDNEKSNRGCTQPFKWQKPEANWETNPKITL